MGLAIYSLPLRRCFPFGICCMCHNQAASKQHENEDKTQRQQRTSTPASFALFGNSASCFHRVLLCAWKLGPPATLVGIGQRNLGRVGSVDRKHAISGDKATLACSARCHAVFFCLCDFFCKFLKMQKDRLWVEFL